MKHRVPIKDMIKSQVKSQDSAQREKFVRVKITKDESDMLDKMAQLLNMNKADIVYQALHDYGLFSAYQEAQSSTKKETKQVKDNPPSEKVDSF